ncbi:MAG TPA: DNA polymerase III subunit alpha, partial [Candidatus Egerieousia sp.]|nr:DNA polymerase III subunit alpha [Candidatus Egerieousia sp.]
KGVVKPIVGCEVYVNPEGRFVKRGKEDQGAYHLILLAKNIEGYYNLVKIVSIGWTEGFYYKPKVDREILEKYHENLIASSACLGGELPRLIAAGNMEEAEKSALWFKKVFGEDYYFEIQQHRTEIPGQSQEVFDKQRIVNAGLFKLSEKLGIKCIATNDCHFVNKEDGPAHDRLICINTNARVTDTDRMHYTQQEYMKTAEEMAAMHITHPEIITNTLEVAAKVEEYDIDHDNILPSFKLPDGYSDSNDYLRDLVYKGAETRYPNMLPKLKERIDFELQTIKGMGFPDYFLIVQDFINAARTRGIWVGPGRGSAAGSVVAYCLGITKIDPIKYDLLFERFLNPERISMPDIDIDFEEERRSDVLAYVEGKYGKDHVSHVVTFGTMATKSAIKDIARIEDVPLAVANKLAGMVPSSFPEEQVKVKRPDGTEEIDSKKVSVNFDNCLKLVPEFKQEYEHPETPEVGETMKYARMLEGTVRNTGVHACAVIIGRDRLSEHIPISTAKDKDTGNDIWVSQYEGSDIEDVGMLKMDFLGLRTLSILKETVENIKKSKKVDIDVDTLPLNDKATFKLFGKGDTVAVFQFESPGMQKWLRELKPNRFEDLIAMNALYRPGPMQYIPDFVNRKNGRTKIVYEMPEMEDILSDTYGVTVYQEQVMLLSQRIASFSKGQADGLRKAMGKKKIDKMMEMEELFMKGGVANGYKEEQLKKIWNDWKEFAKYAFNKSHSTCYAWIAYQTAWLKAHYPAEFMAANMSKNLGDIAEISKLMDECKRMKIKVLGPDVNESGVDFTVTGDNEIRFGLAAIKGVGGAASEVIINKAPYKSIFDFAEKAGSGNINRKTIESLAYAGAFDSSFPEIRRDQYFSENSKGEFFLDALVRYSQIVNKKEDNGGSLFGETDTGFEAQTPEIPAAKTDINNLEFLEKEKEMVGMYISSHPLDMYKFEIDNFTSYNLVQASALVQQVKNNPALADRDFYVGGIVSSLTKKVSQKSGKPFASMILEDYTGTMQFSVFGKDFETFLPFLDQGAALFIKCKLKKRYNSETDYEIRIQKITFLANLKEQFMKGLTLYIQSEKLDKDYRKDLVNTLKANKGTTPLDIVMTEAENSISLNYASSKKVNVDKPLLDELEKMDIKYRAITSVSM